EIIPLIKAGKTESEIIKTLQEIESKKITRYRVVVGDSPSRGPQDAKVTIIEFSDFQCPFCKKVQPTIEKILEKYPNDVKHVFKQHPLAFHKDAPLASEASLAAGEQGMFWDMHGIIFENQKKLKEDDLLRYAKEIGLDVEQFKADLRDHRYKPQVDRETQQAVKIGATGTPAFFVNGRYLSGAKPLNSFVKVIDEELSGKQLPSKWGKNVKEGKGKKKRKADDPNKIYNIPVGDSPFKGPKDAPITVVVFNDFQCPFSKRSQSTTKQLMDAYPNQIKLAFKNFPLGFHKQAMIAAEAALAAGAQGKFWEMHDKIFANQKQINIDTLKGYAKELNLDMSAFNNDIDSHKYKKVIDSDMKLARGAGVRGTPTFFINGKKLVGAKPLTAFQEVIDGINKGKK
ncbi:MAG: thioredoxin domain-containing protein, partial [Deltaproteobacteria bacterium]|nr:thioredoxin domain-containing protein [Deltaproteobacteria bacterium]